MEKNRAYTKDTRDKVLITIIEEGNDGISNKLLAEKTERDRNIISAICKDLEKDDLVEIEKKGKWRTYYPTNKAYDTFAFSDSFYLGQQLQDKILSVRNKVQKDWIGLINLHEKQIMYIKNIFKNYEIIPDKRFEYYMINNETNPENIEMGSLLIILQNFVIKIGVIMTFILLSSLDPKVIKKNSNSELVSDKNSIKKLLELRTKNVISSMELSTEFKRLLSVLESKNRNQSDHNSKSSYQLNPKIIKKSMIILKELYPHIMIEIENICHNLDKIIKSDRVRFKMIDCDHDFSSKVVRNQIIRQEHNNMIFNDSKNKGEYYRTREFVCKKCNIKREIDIGDEIHDELLIKQLNSMTDKKNINSIKKLSKNPKNRKIVSNSQSIYVFKCRENKHVWKLPSVSERILENNRKLTETYKCILCKKIVELDLLNKDTVENIRNDIIEQIGSDRFTLQLADGILSKFFKDKNRRYRINDFESKKSFKSLQYFRKFFASKYDRKTRNEVYTEKEYKNDIGKTIRILMKNQVIKKEENCYVFMNSIIH